MRDKGKGFSAVDQRRVFKPFIKLDNSRSERVGLGPAISKRILRHLNGDIDAIGHP